MRAWLKHNKLEDFNSLLTYDLNDFTPSGILCYYKQKADSEVALMMPNTPEGTLHPLEKHSTSHT